MGFKMESAPGNGNTECINTVLPNMYGLFVNLRFTFWTFVGVVENEARERTRYAMGTICVIYCNVSFALLSLSLLVLDCFNGFMSCVLH